MADVADVRAIAEPLPRSYEVVVRDRVKFRVGRIVWAALSRDEQDIGFAFPKDEREGAIAAEPDVFFHPRASDLRYQWIEAHLQAVSRDRLSELLIEAWLMAVPKRIGADYLAGRMMRD